MLEFLRRGVWGSLLYTKKVPRSYGLAPIEPMNVRLRLMTVDDIQEAMRLKDLAGWNQTAADGSGFFPACPEGCFVAECEGWRGRNFYDDRLRRQVRVDRNGHC